jgi:esterase/lipase superfamily enzyme
MALFLQKVKPQSKVCLFGFSFGSRIVCNAVESLRNSGQCPDGMRLHLVLSGAATDRNWFSKGRQHGRVPEIVEKILVTYSPGDWALRFYPFMYKFPFKEKALGLEGLPLRSIDPVYRDRFENVNVNRYIGDEHKTLRHVQNPAFRNRINSYFFFE